MNEAVKAAYRCVCSTRIAIIIQSALPKSGRENAVLETPYLMSPVVNTSNTSSLHQLILLVCPFSLFSPVSSYDQSMEQARRGCSDCFLGIRAPANGLVGEKNDTAACGQRPTIECGSRTNWTGSQAFSSGFQRQVSTPLVRCGICHAHNACPTPSRTPTIEAKLAAPREEAQHHSHSHR